MTLEIQGVAGDKHNIIAGLNWLMYVGIDEIKYTNSREYSFTMTSISLAISHIFGPTIYSFIYGTG